MKNKANIYPTGGTNPTITHSDSSLNNVGVCFSGGGSRALTCAWGQLLGLKTVGLDSSTRYISSVSGGTWASSIYTYLSDTISDEALLGTYTVPADLSLSDGTDVFNINTLGQHSLGQAPLGMTLKALLGSIAFFSWWYREDKENYKWLWASIVANYILEPYGLRKRGRYPWSSKYSFSLSLEYANQSFPPQSPSTDDFFFVRSGRPFLIMNDNIMEKISGSGKIVQLPNQATPISTGAQGQTPDGSIIGGGSVESYGYSSTLESNSASTSPVKVTIDQAYSLIDSVSTSSAFFAEALAQYFMTEATDSGKREAIASQARKHATAEHKEHLLSSLKEDVDDVEEFIEHSVKDFIEKEAFELSDFVPSYNYWPIGEASENAQTLYTDGGTLDNTGVIGMLAQTDTGEANQAPMWLVVFDNTSTPLEKKSDNIIAGAQAAPLFGMSFNTDNGTYQAFTSDEKDPANQAFVATSLITVFDNKADKGQTPFDALVQGLYATNCGAARGTTPDDATVNTAPAFHQMTLTTVGNTLANITAGRAVHVLYVQNAKMLNWQNGIGDSTLKTDIAAGQEASAGNFADFKDFPNYSTIFKIGLLEKESNALSQMWAWALADDGSQLKPVLAAFMNGAA